MLIASLLAAAVSSGPIYLRCSFAAGADVMITADEANSAVTISIPKTGFIEKMPAAFSAAEVRFSDRVLGYVINRTDLKATRTFNGVEQSEPGVCKIEEAPKRAF